jgi:hypothetical protein
MTLDISEGVTTELGPFILQKTVDGIVSALDLTGCTVTLKLRAPDGTYEDTAGETRMDADPTTGKMYWTPDAGDIVATRTPYTVYSMRWHVDDGAGAVLPVPLGEPDYLRVFKA